jgi:hypothetical protein
MAGDNTRSYFSIAIPRLEPQTCTHALTIQIESAQQWENIADTHCKKCLFVDINLEAINSHHKNG